MNRIYRQRVHNPKTGNWDALFPQTVTDNILRRDDGGVLESWLKYYDDHLDDQIPHLNHATAGGDEHHMTATIRNRPLVDRFLLLLRLTSDLDLEPTLNYNESGDKYIIGGTGERIPGGQRQGTSILLSWNEELDVWVMLSADAYRDDFTKVYIPIYSEYVHTATTDDERLIPIPGFNRNEQNIELNYNQTVLRPSLDYIFTDATGGCIKLLNFGLYAGESIYCKITSYDTVVHRKSVKYSIRLKDYRIRANEDGQTVFEVPSDAWDANEVRFNYGQTIWRNGIDYTMSEDHSTITTTVGLEKNEEIFVTAVKLIEEAGALPSTSWGSNGNYRYEYKVFHGEYMATKDGEIIIPIPNFTRYSDDIVIVRDNQVLVYDVDYILDTLDQVVLLHSTLDQGQSIFYTVRKGFLADEPEFHIIRAKGNTGKDLLLDISYSEVRDFYALVIQLNHALKDSPTIKCVDGPAEPILDGYGEPISGGYVEGGFLFVIYSEANHSWYSMSHGQYDLFGNYPKKLSATGTDYFIGITADDLNHNVTGEVAIAHRLGVTPTHIEVHPIEKPYKIDDVQTSIGDIWFYADDTNLYVGNSGDATSAFRWTVSIDP